MPLTTLITGASAGIGAELARLLGAQGHNVVLAARREAEVKAVADSIGPNALAVVCDVTTRAEVLRLRDAALARFGRIDVWVNNVGRGITRPVMELTDEDLDEMVNVNLRSAIYGMQAAVHVFQEQGSGHVINVSSFLGRVPFATFRSAYSAMKAALNSLTANLRVDLKATHPDIHVSLVMPGVVRTDFGKNALGGMPAQWSGAAAAAPQSAEEVAQAIAEIIANPKPEIYTNPISAAIAQRYYTDVAAFEAGAH